ncbi:hypothetical protein N7539_008256 [Penicillium diatomitis]|uniref:Partial AB-hydrolase lipase domain-containing protein n=1 Tax=Penicillium diatomitis TaxID=2819901 RepID=A0A9W9WTH6_9EURO|nr:uncharacterized protein N7539_008256 [Penicillium diatomitis]KAJ5475190.1 hypothetical protein N7539_008256 [Penicillium diatomitis]
MEVSIPPTTITTSEETLKDGHEPRLVLSTFSDLPDVPSHSPSTELPDISLSETVQGESSESITKTLCDAPEKITESCEQELPALSQKNPLFPPLPSYETPSMSGSIKYLMIRLIAFVLSLSFLTAIFVGALSRTVWTVLGNVGLRLRGKPEPGRIFEAEEKKRRLARDAAHMEWHLRLQNQQLDAEQGQDECPPLEGGKDRLVCDVAYYARRVGLDVETFRVQTEDGYIITLWHVYNPKEYAPLSEEQRRERGPEVFTGANAKSCANTNSNVKPRYPVLLMHGLLQSAGAYCTNDDDSLAFFLCKSGYDVWLGNNRCGMTPEHATLSPSDPRMWSWDIRHLGTLDLAALTSRVLYETGFEKLGLVCHSQGTTQTFVALAKEHRPELGKYISVFCALAPAVYAGPLVRRSYLRFMSKLSPETFRLFFGIHSFIPFMMAVHRVFPPKIYGVLAYCVFSHLFGWSDCRWERDLRDRMFQFAPVYVSAELMRWWLGGEGFAKHKCILAPEEQDAEDTEMPRFTDEPRSVRPEDAMNHGETDRTPKSPNKQSWYGAQTPPFALWIGGSDALVDGRKLLTRFDRGLEPQVNVVHSKIIEEYEHLDVLWAMDAVDQVGKEVRQVIWETMPHGARVACRRPRGVN